ncbi:hypothetical protein Har1130_18010 [Haloarcula sp. CBA1130]|nr:hypothetical protein Har1130_18010 [Haloarcula sp. CBA1130]KAA9397597.1 hypothetical protein Har1129_04795 [Haloarcula sp. CBA1129]
MQAIAGVLLFVAGLTGAIWPEVTLQFWFFGAVNEGSASASTKTFFRGLGVLCAVAGLLVLISG